MLKYRILLMLCGCLCLEFCKGQVNQESDSSVIVTQAPDSSKTENASKLAISASVDYLKFHTLALPETEKYEGSLSLIFFDNNALIGEYGIADISSEETYDNADYTVQGCYFRVGIDHRFTINPGNYLYVGGRYSASTFREEISYVSNNPVFGQFQNNLRRPDNTASWFELVFTSETRIKKIFKINLNDYLFTGFKFRTKYINQVNQYDDIPLNTIVGFGNASNKFNLEFNLYLKFRLNLL